MPLIAEAIKFVLKSDSCTRTATRVITHKLVIVDTSQNTKIQWLN